ncbi:MAG: hypothetical protein DCF20_12830 [Pseudanabaena sp.]|nr:MAG: hypothetical protein DCF20_12830 [Pseudanabaena sp.]
MTAVGYMGKTVVRFCVIALTTILIVVSLGGLYPQSLRANNDNAIAIAVAAPISGDVASGGQEIVDSIKLYIDATNREGGINGRQLKLNVFDDKGNAEGATQVANEISKSDALVVLGIALQMLLSRQVAFIKNANYQQLRVRRIILKLLSIALTIFGLFIPIQI